MNHTADVADNILRISMDAKPSVKSWPLRPWGEESGPSRCGGPRFSARGDDAVGITSRRWDRLFVYGITSKVTSDCLVDRIVQWWETVRERLAHITTLVINLDNGPENHNWRTQFMQRMVEFVHQYRVHAVGLLPAVP